jgi:hypothetical protein
MPTQVSSTAQISGSGTAVTMTVSFSNALMPWAKTLRP